MRKEKKTANSTVDRKQRRLQLRCPLCKPNRGENRKRCPHHGAKKPKYKDKRK